MSSDPDHDVPTDPAPPIVDRDATTVPPRKPFELPERKQYAPPPAEPTLLDLMTALHTIRGDILDHVDACTTQMVAHVVEVLESEIADTKANSARLAKQLRTSIDHVLDTNERVRVFPGIVSRSLRDLAADIDQKHRELDVRSGRVRTDAE